MPGDDHLGAAFDVAAFMAMTGCEDEATASFFVESAAGNADLALELYYDDADDEADNEAAIAALAIPPPVSVRSSFASRKKQKKHARKAARHARAQALLLREGGVEDVMRGPHLPAPQPKASSTQRAKGENAWTDKDDAVVTPAPSATYEVDDDGREAHADSSGAEESEWRYEGPGTAGPWDDRRRKLLSAHLDSASATTCQALGPKQPSGKTFATIACCLCGTRIVPGEANMCRPCLKTQLDRAPFAVPTTEIRQCGECRRYENYKGIFLEAEWESAMLLAICLKKFAPHLKRVSVVDAGFVYTEPHSRRIRVKIVVLREAFDDPGASVHSVGRGASGAVGAGIGLAGGVSFRQTLIAELRVRARMCPRCQKAVTNQTWTSKVQIRQPAGGSGSGPGAAMARLEQLMLNHGAHREAINIAQEGGGLDLFFSDDAAARRLANFVESRMPVAKRVRARALVSTDVKSNVHRCQLTHKLDLVAVNRGDLVCLPASTARSLGVRNPLLCLRVASSVRLLSVCEEALRTRAAAAPVAAEPGPRRSHARARRGGGKIRVVVDAPASKLRDGLRLLCAPDRDTVRFVVMDVRATERERAGRWAREARRLVRESRSSESARDGGTTGGGARSDGRKLPHSRNDASDPAPASAGRNSLGGQSDEGAEGASDEGADDTDAALVLTEVEVARVGQFDAPGTGGVIATSTVLCHFGHLLAVGDEVLGYDAGACNFSTGQLDALDAASGAVPEIVLVSKRKEKGRRKRAGKAARKGRHKADTGAVVVEAVAAEAVAAMREIRTDLGESAAPVPLEAGRAEPLGGAADMLGSDPSPRSVLADKRRIDKRQIEKLEAVQKAWAEQQRRRAAGVHSLKNVSQAMKKEMKKWMI
jgi:NMD protein affecting ribosome stability and mRNA decay